MNNGGPFRLLQIGLTMVATAVTGAAIFLAAPATAQSSSGTILGFNVEWSPDAKSFAFSANWDGDWEIYTMDVDGQNIRQLTHNNQSDFIPSFSKDGKSLLYSSRVDDKFEIHRVSVDGGPPKVLAAVPKASLFWPEEGPDGRIIFVANIIDGNGAADIRVLDPGSGAVVTLVGDGSRNDTPTWLPTGTGFLFSSDRGGKLHIYAADADGSNQRVLTTLPAGAERYGSAKPSLTPDGRTVVYWGDEGGNFMHDHHHNVLDMESGEVRVLPKRILSMAYPDVSPDGRQIVYAAGLGGDRPFSVYVMDLDGSNHRTIWAPQE